jgi:NADH-quinone oxidoreductase subunit N
MITAPEIDLISLAPVLVLSVFTMLVMLMDLFIGKNKSALVFVALWSTTCRFFSR